MQDSPPASVLLDTIAAFLEQEVMPDYEGRKAFQVRIAASVCRILSRESALDPGFLAHEEKRLSEHLGLTPDPAPAPDLEDHVRELIAMLAGGIRDGDVDSASPATMSLLAELVGHKLAVVNPGYGKPAAPQTDTSKGS